MPTSRHPVWELYNEYRTMRLNAKYYSIQLKKAIKWNRLTEGLVALFSSSAIVSWIFTSWGLIAWKILGSLAAMITIYRFYFQKPYDNIVKFERMTTFYKGIEFQLETLCRKIKELRAYDNSLLKDFEEIVIRRQTFAQTYGDTERDEKLLKRLQEEVKRELPVENFYEPEGDINER